MIRINLSGGVSGTVVGDFGFPTVFGLATADNGILYGVSGTQIISVNTNTGLGTLVLDYGGRGLNQAFGTAFFTEAGATAVPEPPTLALISVGASSLLAWAWQRRRRGERRREEMVR